MINKATQANWSNGGARFENQNRSISRSQGRCKSASKTAYMFNRFSVKLIENESGVYEELLKCFFTVQIIMH